MPANFADLLHKFRRAIIALRKANHIDPSQIVNMDQTMCRFDMPPNRTNHVKGSKTIRIKTTQAEKKGFTVALAATAAGEKLPAVVIFKECGGSLGARVQWNLCIPPNIRVRATTSSWMTTEECHFWLEQAKCHCNADVVIIPDGCTSIVQPMDRCINKPFKESMRASWQEWMREDRAKTTMGNLKQPTRQDVLNWVSKAWESIK